MSTTDEYPEHLNPFKRRGIRGSFRELKRNISRRFRRKDDDSHSIDRTPAGVSVHIPSNDGVQMRRRGDVPVIQVKPSSEVFPRSRFNERVNRAQTLAPNVNPFEIDNGGIEKVSSEKTDGVQNGDVQKPQPPDRKRYRRKKRAPLPPGMIGANGGLTVGDHRQSQWSISSYETDCSSSQAYYSEETDHEFNTSRSLQQLNENQEVELKDISKAIMEYCGTVEGGKTGDEEENISTVTTAVVIKDDEECSSTVAVNEEDSTVATAIEVKGTVVVDGVKVDEEDSTVATTIDEVKSDAECSTVAAGEEGIIVATTEAKADEEEISTVTTALEIKGDVEVDKVKCDDEDSTVVTAVVETKPNNTDQEIKKSSTTNDDVIKEESSTNDDVIKEERSPANDDDEESTTKTDEVGVDENTNTNTNTNGAINPDNIANNNYIEDTSDSTPGGNTKKTPTDHDSHETDINPSDDQSECTKKEYDENFNDKSMSTEDDADLYVESKTLYITGSSDNLLDDSTNFRTKTAIYLTGSCDQLNSDDPNLTCDSDKPVPKVRKHKPTRESLLNGSQ